jgi:hypothetical protein
MPLLIFLRGVVACGPYKSAQQAYEEATRFELLSAPHRLGRRGGPATCRLRHRATSDLAHCAGAACERRELHDFSTARPTMPPVRRRARECASRPGRGKSRGSRCSRRGWRRRCGRSIDRIRLRTRRRRCRFWRGYGPPSRAACRLGTWPRAGSRGSARLRHGIHAMHGRQWRAHRGAGPCAHGLRGSRRRCGPCAVLSTAPAVPAASATPAATLMETGWWRGERHRSDVSGSMYHRRELMT